MSSTTQLHHAARAAALKQYQTETGHSLAQFLFWIDSQKNLKFPDFLAEAKDNRAQLQAVTIRYGQHIIDALTCFMIDVMDLMRSQSLAADREYIGVVTCYPTPRGGEIAVVLHDDPRADLVRLEHYLAAELTRAEMMTGNALHLSSIRIAA